MRREDLEHLIRAADAVSGSRRIVVIGSQAILGQFPHDAPPLTTFEKDRDFCRAVVHARLVDRDVLLERLARTSIDDARRERVESWIVADFRVFS